MICSLFVGWIQAAMTRRSPGTSRSFTVFKQVMWISSLDLILVLGRTDNIKISGVCLYCIDNASVLTRAPHAGLYWQSQWPHGSTASYNAGIWIRNLQYYVYTHFWLSLKFMTHSFSRMIWSWTAWDVSFKLSNQAAWGIRPLASSSGRIKQTSLNNPLALAFLAIIKALIHHYNCLIESRIREFIWAFFSSEARKRTSENASRFWIIKWMLPNCLCLY